MQFGCACKLLFVISLFFAGIPNVAFCQDSDPIVQEMERARQKLLHEATELFTVITRDEIKSFHRCEISSKWDSYAIDETTAKMQFDLHVHASLSSPNHGTIPSDILDPKKKFKDIFCTEDESHQNMMSSVRALKQQPIISKADKSIDFTFRSYAFPIFNDDYTKALLGTGVTYSSWRSPIRSGFFELTVVTEIYTKRNGTWEYTGNLGSSGGHGMIEAPK